MKINANILDNPNMLEIAGDSIAYWSSDCRPEMGGGTL